MLNFTSAINIKDPALVSRWFLSVPDVEGPYHCIAETVELPFDKNQPKGRHFQGTQRFYPDFRDIDGVTVVFYETHDFQVTRWLNNWRKQIYRSNGTFGLPSEYKKSMYAYMYSLTSNSPILTYHIRGCWPTDKIPYNLTHEDEEGRIQTACLFSVDGVDQQD